MTRGCRLSSQSRRSAKRMIRIYQHGDEVAIAEIFTAAVHEIASKDYSLEQCMAWSSREVNYEHWKRRCELKRPFVAVVDSEIAGFLELDPHGHIDCAYVNPQFQRRGIMSRLVEHAVDSCFALGINRVYADASICAKPMFEKLGFRTTEERLVSVNGMQLLNYRVERVRGEAEPDGGPNRVPLRSAG